jgi:hypothetical protein
MYIKEIPDSYMSGILFGKVEVTFSIDLVCDNVIFVSVL